MRKSIRLNNKQLAKPNFYSDTTQACPFCTTGAWVSAGAWVSTGNELFKESTCSTVFWVANAYQVIPDIQLTLVIENATCESQLGAYGLAHCRTYFDMIEYAYKTLKNDYETVIVYKNHGGLAGGSVIHAHTQVAATNNVELRLPEWSYKGLDVYVAENLTVNIATEGIGETYEINIMNHDAGWGDDSLKALEGVINYIHKVYGEGGSYNLLVDNETYRMKVVCRTQGVSILNYYGVQLYPPLEALESFAEKLGDRLLTILNG